MATNRTTQERQRRAQQSSTAKGANQPAATNAAAEAMLAATSNGRGMTKGQQAQLEARLAAVNLDEVAEQPFTVVYRDLIEEQVQDEAFPDDPTKTRSRKRPITRTAILDPMVPASLQLDAMSLNMDESKTQREQLLSMVDLVVKAWTRTEPDMTTEKLIEVMDITRISALFKRFFNPATLQ